MEIKISWIVKKYDLVGAISINSLRHLIATFINDADYSDTQGAKPTKSFCGPLPVFCPECWTFSKNLPLGL